jgi:DNA-binding NarL/FixJ family response regulator
LLDSPVRAAHDAFGRPAATGDALDDHGRIRVLLVDDHAVVRTGLRTFFDLLDDVEVVGEATDGSEGVAMARRLRPDVVLMDLLMPNMDGITAIGRIKAELPETEIVTMTSFIEEEKVTSALEAGASGYVLKDAEAEEVAAAIRAAYRGEVHLDAAVARMLAQRMRARKTEPEPVEPLTDREKDVLRLRAVHHGADGADVRLEHPRQARARVADAGRALRGRAQARGAPEGVAAVIRAAGPRPACASPGLCEHFPRARTRSGIPGRGGATTIRGVAKRIVGQMADCIRHEWRPAAGRRRRWRRPIAPIHRRRCPGLDLATG